MKKILALILALVGLTTFTLTGCNVKPTLPENNNELVQSEKKPVLIQAINCSLSPTVTTYSEGDQVYLSKTITATVEPVNASNKALDFSIDWQAGAERSAEPVTDYVNVIQDSDGSLSATVYCYKAFGDDKVIITATARDGGAKGFCTVNYVGIASEMNVTSTLSVSNNEERGDYYELTTNQSYDFNVELSNIFGATSYSDLTYAVTGYGSFYVTSLSVDVENTYLFDFSTCDIEEKYFNVNVANNKICITTNDNSFSSGSFVDYFYKDSSTSFWVEEKGYIIDSYNFSTVQDFVNRYPNAVKENSIGSLVIPDKDGNPTYKLHDLLRPNSFPSEPGSFMISYYKESVYNLSALSSYYFEITISDSVSGMSKSFKFTIRPAVSSVNLPDNIEF